MEAAVTRRFLEHVPFDRLEFQPTEKSEPLGRLDFTHFQPRVFTSSTALLSYFDSLLADAKRALAVVDDAQFSKPWSMTHGGEVLFTLPKKQVARLFCMNHLVHHRSQLGMYSRLLGVVVPATYGPSADDDSVILIKPMV